MAFKKGEAKPPTSGRKKGVPNRTTAQHRQMISEFLSQNATPEELKKMADAMEAKDRGAFYVKLFNFVLPRLQGHEIGLSENISHEQAREILKGFIKEPEDGK